MATESYSVEISTPIILLILSKEKQLTEITTGIKLGIFVVEISVPSYIPGSILAKSSRWTCVTSLETEISTGNIPFPRFVPVKF